MAPKVTWLLVFVLLYWAYCLFWGIRGARMARTASDYFIAGRKLSLWIFVLAATATSYSGWTFMGHPGLVYRDGFQYAFASFYAVVIPLTGIIFLKRQWMLGKRFGYITPGEMMADYFQGDAIRILTVIVALFYSIPYLGVQLAASGYLFNVITDGIIDVAYGAVILSIVVLLYVASGGLRAVAYVDTVQCILLWLGIVIVGMIAISFVGGWDALIIAMSRLGASSIGEYGTTQNVAGSGGDFNAYFAVPGVIQFTAGLGKETPIGGIWTAVMILTYMFALMGIQAAPAFSMWAFSNTNPAPFAPQAVWASAMWIGGTLIFFTTFQGMAAHFLGANPVVTEAGLAVDPTVLPVAIAADPDTLVPHYFNLIADIAPWLVGLLAVCALAAMQSTGAAYMSTGGGILTRDLYKRYLNPGATHATQKLFGRLGVTLIVILALIVAIYSRDALVPAGRSRRCFRIPNVRPAARHLLLSLDHPRRSHLGSRCRIACRRFNRQRRPGSLRWIASLGPVALDHLLRRVGYFGKRRHVPRCLRLHAARAGTHSPHEVSYVSSRPHPLAGIKTPTDTGRLGRNDRLVLFRNRPRVRYRKLGIRHTRFGPIGMDVRYSLDLGLADHLLAAWHRSPLVSCLHHGTGHGSG